MNIQREIKMITKCTDEEAKIIHLILLQEFVNVGAVKFSYFVSHVKKAHLLIMLKYSKN